MLRTARITRKTKETDIDVTITLDSLDESQVASGVPFFDHMLLSMARHGRFCIRLSCNGDTIIDDHHTVEDVGICIGKTIKKALGTGKGISRFGTAIIPMDDALAMAAIDISGRSYFNYKGEPLRGYISQYSEELTVEFFRSFTVNAGINLHLELMHGSNRHHIHEALFKAAAHALYRAMSLDDFLKSTVLSEKGTIT